jgi:trehalose 6-phosphate synthase
VPARRRAAKRSSFVVVANTLPVRRETVDGKELWVSSPGGLVSALVPIARKARGAWIGWTGAAGDVPAPFRSEGIRNVPVAMSPADLAGSYHGVCNRTLWPLYHDAIRQPEYHRHWWDRYLEVNRRFAEAAAREAATGAAVWVQDYHLQLVPAMLRRLRPDLRIGFFLHIPFPPQELFLRLPWRRQIVEGLLGADVVGFQTRTGASNFLRLAQRLSSVARRGRRLDFDGRTIEVKAFPISIDAARFSSVADEPAVQERSEEMRRRMGQGRTILLGVDRLDYTKGIDLRLEAFQELLSSSRRSVDDAVFIQVAVPSRERIVEYQELRSEVEELVGQINGQHAELGRVAVHYLRRTFPIEELVALYRAADVMIVTPLCDGMNLVAKEYVASRTDGDGVLVLSEFAGAAFELRSALLVNPHDVNGMAEAMEKGLSMPAGERRRRMKSLRRVVAGYTVHDWAKSFLGALHR